MIKEKFERIPKIIPKNIFKIDLILLEYNKDTVSFNSSKEARSMNSNRLVSCFLCL